MYTVQETRIDVAGVSLEVKVVEARFLHEYWLVNKDPLHSI